jgi:hypothetical protein
MFTCMSCTQYPWVAELVNNPNHQRRFHKFESRDFAAGKSAYISMFLIAKEHTTLVLSCAAVQGGGQEGYTSSPRNLVQCAREN